MADRSPIAGLRTDVKPLPEAKCSSRSRASRAPTPDGAGRGQDLRSPGAGPVIALRTRNSDTFVTLMRRPWGQKRSLILFLRKSKTQGRSTSLRLTVRMTMLRTTLAGVASWVRSIRRADGPLLRVAVLDARWEVARTLSGTTDSVTPTNKTVAVGEAVSSPAE
jgi:hypothetical protein